MKDFTAFIEVKVKELLRTDMQRIFAEESYRRKKNIMFFIGNFRDNYLFIYGTKRTELLKVAEFTGYTAL